MAKKHTQGRSPLAPDKDEAGTYYRRIEDIDRALTRMRVDDMPPVAQYVALYFGCEKLHKIVIALSKRAKGARPRTNDIAAALPCLGLSFDATDLAWLFSDDIDAVKGLPSPGPSVNRPARLIRNNLAHALGPTHVEHVEHHAAFHVPKMKAFLALGPSVLRYLETHYSHL